MNLQTMSSVSAELILRYYENEPMSFLEHMDDEAMWYGPAEGQFIRGREEMIRAWSREEHPLTFTVASMKTRANSAHPSSCNVMLTYTVVTHYPNGHDISVFQRTLLCWGERTVTDENGRKSKIPRIMVCHISNPHRKHDEDHIYPKNYDQVYAGHHVMPQQGQRLHFHGTDRSEFYYLSDSILWVEAAKGGRHCVLHTAEDNAEILATITELADRYPRLFLRCHQSFLVNPNYIRAIRRFEVELSDGTTLPIPEKKYTAFREQAEKLL